MLNLIRTTVVLALAITATALLPSSAHAFSQPIARDVVASNYQGWAYVRHHCQGAMACTADYQTRDAWRWNGSSWTSSGIGEGTRVYAWPYAAGWHWAWTQTTGWLAMRTSDITYHR